MRLAGHDTKLLVFDYSPNISDSLILVPVSTRGYKLVTDIVDGRPLGYYPE